MKITQKQQGHRTLLFEGDQHVGTIVEQQKPDTKTKRGLYQWIVSSKSDHAGTFDEAYDKIVAELQR